MLKWDYKKEKEHLGWYNGYNRNIYKKNKYNSEAAKNDIKIDLEQTINKFKNDSNYTRKFFYKKIVSEWNNPTFQSFWISKARRTGTRKEKSAIVKSINGTGLTNKVITQYMNIIQSIILFGALVFMIINFKTNKEKQIIFAIIFIGGFLFHLIWEAKCQYTITYFVLLIPYTIRGYIQLSKIIDEKMKNIKTK